MKKLFLILIFSLLILSSCKKVDTIPIVKEGFYFDTVISIAIFDENRDDAYELIDNCFILCKDLEEKFSNTITGSEIYNINHSVSYPVNVSKECIEVLKKSKEYYELSNKKFDITMGNVTALWDFNSLIIPNKDELSQLASYCDADKIVIENNQVMLTDPNVSIDLGGIAKGYFADVLKEYLISNDVKSAIINLGGNVSCIGIRPDGKPFNVGIQNPFVETEKAYLVIKCDNKSVVTSGTYQRYFEVDGVKYHHILDNNTGLPVNNGISSVSIYSDSGIDADALSTTCFLLGVDKGLALIEQINNTEIIYILDSGEIITSSGLKEDKDYYIN